MMAAVTPDNSTLARLTMLADLDLPPRAFNALERAGIRTIAQLAEWSERDLLALPQFGHAGLSALQMAIARVLASDPGDC